LERSRAHQGRGRETIEANAVISAVGQLNRPRLPEIAGRDGFQGIAFHSARWEHQHDLRGKRIGVIGTGASAFQFVPEIAKVAADVVVFQRTPPWILPTPDYHADIPGGSTGC
jgi:4-hydroxyacetophenone monooxygenase